MSQRTQVTTNRKVFFFVTNDNNHQILSNNNNICSVQLSLKNKLHSWLLDTGASISAVKYKHILAQNIPIHKENFIVNGIGGSIQAKGSVCLQLTAGDLKLSHKFYVFDSLPCIDDGILGNDFLTKYQSVINLNKSTLLLFDSVNRRINLKISKKNVKAYSYFLLDPNLYIILKLIF